MVSQLSPKKKKKRNHCLLGCFPRNFGRIENTLLAERQTIPASSVLATETQWREGTEITRELESSWTERETEYFRGLPMLQLLDSLIKQH